MFKINMVQTNLRVLVKLNEGPISLDDLAKYLHIKQGRLDMPLNMLQEQNLIQEKEGFYSLQEKSSQLQGMLNLMDPWMNYFDGQYYEVAKDIAEIIHKKSYLDVGVEGVVIFGSLARGDTNPNDIDMLILHRGHKLEEFSKDPYGERADWVMESDSGVRTGNRRLDAYAIFWSLGYRGDPADDYYTQDREKEHKLMQDSAMHNIIKRVGVLGIPPLESPYGFNYPDSDRERLSLLLDVHVLSTRMFGKKDETDFYFSSSPQEPIDNCRDPTFWHTVLSEGKMYDPGRHDFTLTVEDKFPGAAKLFEQ